MENINVRLSEGKLSISGERKLEKEENKKNFVRVEKVYGSFNFTLGIPVKEDKTRASYKDSILKITLPKAEAKKAKRIEIQSK